MATATRSRLATAHNAGRRLAPLSTAAAYAGVHPRTIRRRIADGFLTGYRFGPRVIRVDLDELDSLLQPIPTAGGAPPGHQAAALASGGTTSAETRSQARRHRGDAA